MELNLLFVPDGDTFLLSHQVDVTIFKTEISSSPVPPSSLVGGGGGANGITPTSSNSPSFSGLLFLKSLVHKSRTSSQSNSSSLPHDSSTTSPTPEIIHQGWLIKSPPTKGIFKPRWRKRWFILKAGLFPNQFVLEYYTDETRRRQKGHINLDECQQISAPNPGEERRKYTFNLKTVSRTYFLTSESNEEMNKWVKCLCQVSGLKTTEEDDEAYSHRDEKCEIEEHHGESDESSPTLSTSGPYIPISECFTGNPIHFNEYGVMQENYANATLFPFPPSVNWATHPAIKETPDRSPRSIGPIPPPRPPKTRSPRSLLPPLSSPPPLPRESKRNGGGNSGDNKFSISTPALPLYPTERSGGREEGGEGGPTSAPSSSTVFEYEGRSLYSNLAQFPEEEEEGGGGGESSGESSPAPKINRSLKPDLRGGRSGSATLPSSKGGGQKFFFGPHIDRSRKPPESALKLGPTPVQVKRQTESVHHTLPAHGTDRAGGSSPRRRNGPVLSPDHSHHHHHDQDLMGTYLQIETLPRRGAGEGIKMSRTPPGKKALSPVEEQGSGVEYKLIDHVKTKALSLTKQEREEHLRRSIPFVKTIHC